MHNRQQKRRVINICFQCSYAYGGRFTKSGYEEADSDGWGRNIRLGKKGVPYRAQMGIPYANHTLQIDRWIFTFSNSQTTSTDTTSLAQTMQTSAEFSHFAIKISSPNRGISTAYSYNIMRKSPTHCPLQHRRGERSWRVGCPDPQCNWHKWCRTGWAPRWRCYSPHPEWCQLFGRLGGHWRWQLKSISQPSCSPAGTFPESRGHKVRVALFWPRWSFQTNNCKTIDKIGIAILK